MYKRQVQNPLNTKYHDRIYRTGDLVYENEEGNIIFIGRKDSQIKVRGNRIELGDLESAAAAIEKVASACALFDADKQEIVLFIETTAEIVARKFKMEQMCIRDRIYTVYHIQNGIASII